MSRHSQKNTFGRDPDRSIGRRESLTHPNPLLPKRGSKVRRLGMPLTRDVGRGPDTRKKIHSVGIPIAALGDVRRYGRCYMLRIS
mgnify:CR=1 FL=1